MDRGFYTLGSGLISQNRRLTAISNNIANAETNGYKKQRVSTTTFGDMVISRIDSKSTTPIGSLSLATVADKTNVIHSEGDLKTTDRSLDFAIQGEGFFAVQGQNGTRYTRNGSFNVDQEGYLVLNNEGRVLGSNGSPIHVGTDQVSADIQGNIVAGGTVVGKLGVYNFTDYNSLKLADNGMYTAAGGATLVQSPSVAWKKLEGSNVNAAEEMTSAMSIQRELQNCSQAIKMYDQIMGRSVTEIAKI